MVLSLRETDRFDPGDCRDGLRGLPDGCVDLVLTSPPYDEIRDFGSAWNWEVFTEVAAQLVRVIKPGGVICWQVQDGVIRSGPLKYSYSGTSYRQAIHFQDLSLLIWDELIASGAGSRIGYPGRYGTALHHVFIFSKGRPSYINIIRDRPNRTVGQYTPSWRRNEDGTRYRAQKSYRIRRWGQRWSVWLYATGRQVASDGTASRHPAPMIEQLARDLIISYSRPGEIVCDTFGGIGTTAVACIGLSRRYLGWEINPEYHAVALERIAAAKERYRLELDREI